MSLLDRIAARQSGTPVQTLAVPEVKSFTEPAFWTSDVLSNSWPSNAATGPEQEVLDISFVAYATQLYKRNGVVFSAIDRRQQVFSQARFQWQRYRDGRPQDMFGNPELGLLEKPWPNGTTGEMLSRMEVDGSLAGNSYWTTCDDAGRLGRSARREANRRLVRMRPDWVTIIIGAPSGNPYALDARIVAYAFQPRADNGYGNNGYATYVQEPVILLPSEVCHYSPKPDPLARFIGMSWLTPIITDIFADDAAAIHKMSFFKNGASPRLAVTFDKEVPPKDLDLYKKKFDDMHSGVENAYGTLFMGGGADVRPLTVDLRALDYKMTTGAGETRMAVASGVPAVILGISEGLGGSSLNEGNFRAAKRLFVDGTIQDLWRKVAPSLAVLLTPPADGAELVIDGRDIPFLREDADSQAAIRAQDAQTMRTLGDGGWEPESIKLYMATSDPTRLVHSGMVPVQLQAPGAAKAGETGTDSDEEAKVLVALAAQVSAAIGGPVMTQDEARQILNAAGANLRIPGPGIPKPPPPPAAPAADDAPPAPVGGE